MQKHTKLIYPDWPAPAHIHALSTSRHGGFSKAPYDSLNLADHVGDDPARVRRNRQLLGNLLQLDLQNGWLAQNHSHYWLRAEDLPKNNQGDAVYTFLPGKPCCVLTADCVPVLLCSMDGDFVAAVHAGWQGMENGIIKKVADYYPQPHRLMAWIGPCIHPQHFEVGEDFYLRFMRQDRNWQQAFRKPHGPQGKWHFDLPMAATMQLRQVGIEQIYGCDYCTWQQNEDFYSYRKEGTCGRIASLVWMD